MKKLSKLLLALFLTGTAAQAQFITPAFPETVYPTAPMAVVLRPQHTSCYSMSGIGYGGVANNLYIHTWNSSGGPVNGIAWRRTDPVTGSTFNVGTAVINGNIRDLEAVFVQISGNFYVVATYYEVGVGFFYRIYLWTPTALNPVGTPTLLQSCSDYRRISLDAHKLYGIAITWQDITGRVYVKVADATGGTLVIGNNIAVTNASNAAIPDVAIADAGNLLVRIAFVDQGSGEINVMNESFNTLLVATSPMPFVLDDLNPASFPSPLLVDPFRSNNLQLDCPDHYIDDNWSYVYTDDQRNVFARIRTRAVSPVPFTVNLSNWLGSFRNEYVTIAYRPDGTGIHYGWFTGYTGNPLPGFIATQLNDDGSFVTPPGTFKVVANSTTYCSEPVLSFSKQNDLSDRLFAVYPMFGTGGTGYEIRSKIIPWSSPSFISTPVTPGTETASAAGTELSVFPNPFTETFRISVKNDVPTAVYEATLADLQGKTIARPKGSLGTVNQNLQGVADQLPAGLYFLTVKNDGGLHQTLRVVKSEK